MGKDLEFRYLVVVKKKQVLHVQSGGHMATYIQPETSLIQTPFIRKLHYPAVIPGDQLQFSNIT